MMTAQFKEFRKDGWPLCPQCEEDELYSYLMLGWTKDERPSIQECINAGMQCYRCNWKSQKDPMAIFGHKCFRCNLVFTTGLNQPAYVHCCKCRLEIKDEAERDRIRQEVERMDWPDVIGV